MHFSLSLLLVILLSSSGFGSENLVPSGNFEDDHLVEQWSPTKAALQEPGEKASGDYSLRFRITHDQARSPELIPVEAEKHYELKALIKEPETKRAQESTAFNAHIGLIFYDQYEEEIPPLAVQAVPDSEATLARDVAIGDSSVFLNGEPWTTQPLTGIAFDTKEDFSDIPNMSVIQIRGLSTKEGITEVKLGTPTTQAYPAGTPVRRHLYTDRPTIVALPDSDWSEHSMTINGVSEPGSIGRRQFWPGTKHVRVVIVPVLEEASGKPKNVDLLVDDVTFVSLSD